MRDDLHKGARVPSAWRSLIRAAARNADWAVNGPRSAERAVQSLMRDFSPPLLKAVQELFAGRQLSLDPIREVEHLRQQFHASTCASVFLDELKVALKEPATHLSPRFIQDAIASAARECSERFIRATALHVDRKSPEDTKELTHRMRTLLASVDFQERAALSAIGSSPKKTSAKQAVDPDEGLPLGEGNV